MFATPGKHFLTIAICIVVTFAVYHTAVAAPHAPNVVFFLDGVDTVLPQAGAALTSLDALVRAAFGVALLALALSQFPFVACRFDKTRWRPKRESFGLHRACSTSTDTRRTSSSRSSGRMAMTPHGLLAVAVRGSAASS